MSGVNDGEDKVNMIPMIDTMLFLILFFMLVTKFTPEEKSISSLLPSQGGITKGQLPVIQPPAITIAVYPAGLEKGFQPTDYERQIAEREQTGTLSDAVCVRVGGDAPIIVQGRPLSETTLGSKEMRTQMTDVHTYIDQALAQRDQMAKSRTDLPKVIIACYSGLDWKFALLAYDAVRAHESAAAGVAAITPDDLLAAREVDFAPPRIRHYTPHELGEELYEIVHSH